MLAMSVNWHLTKALEENQFAQVSDKLRDQLIENGVSARDAAMQAPVMLHGMDKALQGEFDFKRVREELAHEKRTQDGSGHLVPSPSG